jgi:antitoxin component of RelBE/YafQ-DinJ toxin-antitoxin module
MRTNRAALIAFRVTTTEKEAFEALANDQGMLVSEILRQFVQQKIKKASKVPAG